jgi:dolichol-phosphate mannosyltransferase
LPFVLTETAKNGRLSQKDFELTGAPPKDLQVLPAVPPANEILVSVVVPTYREAKNLPLLVPRITSALQLWSHEVIIVDDYSNDGTSEACANMRTEGHAVRLILRTDQRGLSSAVLRGFIEARGKVLVCMDADLSHPPEALPHMIETLEKDRAEFVIGSRYVRGGTTDAEWSLVRKFQSKVATLMARPLCRVSDPLAGYFALPRTVFERAQVLSPVGYKIGLELIVKCGCTRIAELPIHFSDRRFGQSKLSLREQINYLRHLKRLADFKFGGWSQLGQFSVVGASGMAVDLLAYALLLRAGVALPVARALAIFIAMSWNFALNRRVSFSRNRFGRPIIQQYFLWLASSGVGAVTSWSVAVSLTSFTKFFAADVFLAAILGIAIGGLINFLLARHWTFASP